PGRSSRSAPLPPTSPIDPSRPQKPASHTPPSLPSPHGSRASRSATHAAPPGRDEMSEIAPASCRPFALRSSSRIPSPTSCEHQSLLLDLPELPLVHLLMNVLRTRTPQVTFRFCCACFRPVARSD